MPLSPPLLGLSAGITWWTQGRWTPGEAKAMQSKLLMTTTTKVIKHWVALFQLVSGCCCTATPLLLQVAARA